MEFGTYFRYFHTFSYKFKVQRTPTESGPQFIYYVALLPRLHAYVVSVYDDEKIFS